MKEKTASVFEYKSTVGAIIDRKQFAVGCINNTYCIVAPVSKFYTVYDIERLNVVSRSSEIEEVLCVGIFGRYVITGCADKKVYLSNRGKVLLEVQLEDMPREIVCTRSAIIVLLKKSMVKIEVDLDSASLENPLEDVHAEAVPLPGLEGKVLHKIHLLSGDKVLAVADGALVVYNTKKESVVYTVSSASFSKVLDISVSLSPSIVALSTEKEVVVLDVKKDVVLQRVQIPHCVSIDFRRTLTDKELAVCTEKEVAVVCLERGVVKKRMPALGSAHVRFIGSESYMVLSMPNELRILNCKHKLETVKRRAGIVFGEASVAEFFRGALVVSTNNRVYSMSLRKEEQTKEISHISTDASLSCAASPVSLAAKRGRVLVCFEKSLSRLEHTVGGLATTKKSLMHKSARAFLGAELSFCGNLAVVALEHEDGQVQVLCLSAESGFILGDIKEKPCLAMSVNSAAQEVTLVHHEDITVYTLSGAFVSRTPIPPCKTAFIVDTRTDKYVVSASGKHLCVIKRTGEVIRKIKTTEGEPVRVRTTKDFSWVSLLTKLKKSTVFEVFDMETGKEVSSMRFAPAEEPRDCLITEDKALLAVVTRSRVLLYTNKQIFCTRKEESKKSAVSQGLGFSSPCRTKARLLLEYAQLSKRTEEETQQEMLPYAVVSKENTAGLGLGPCAQMQSSEELIASLLDPNYPISSVIEQIKNTPVPEEWVVQLVDRLETEHDIVDALLQTVIQYRRKDLITDSVKKALERREKISEKFVEEYLTVLSLTK
ncbi:hypothetical protein NECID01_1023 [Nematocida sp. AWRm77]|nr:hypothetical protein NECID01_1023 [Nematocida sp. AWRm77]